MKKHILYLFLLIILLHVSCRDTKLIRFISPNNIEVTDQQEKNKLFNDYFTLESIIPIETSKDCLINQIRRILLHEDKLFILNGYSEIIAINTKTGKYSGHLRKIGNGPGEYSKIMDITFLEEKGDIVIYTDTKKLLLYDSDFNYKEEISIGNRLFEGFTSLNDTLYFFNPLSMSESYNNIIVIYNLKERKWIKETGDRTNSFSIRGYGPSIVKNQSIWYTSPLKNTLSNLDQTQLKVIYTLNNTYKWGDPDKLIELQQQNFMSLLQFLNTEKICYAISAPRETKDFIYCKSNLHPLIIIDKRTNEASYFDFDALIDFSFGFSGFDYFPHDGKDNRILFILPAKNWLEINHSNPAIPLNLQEIEIKADSSPILLFYNLL